MLLIGLDELLPNFRVGRFIFESYLLPHNFVAFQLNLRFSKSIFCIKNATSENYHAGSDGNG